MAVNLADVARLVVDSSLVVQFWRVFCFVSARRDAVFGHVNRVLVRIISVVDVDQELFVSPRNRAKTILLVATEDTCVASIPLLYFHEIFDDSEITHVLVDFHQ